MNKIYKLLNHSFQFNEEIQITVGGILLIVIIFLGTRFLLKLAKKTINNKLEEENRGKVKTIFSFFNYFVYLILITLALDAAGIKVSVILAGSAALLVGLGLGLQTLFQDIISGIFSFVDKTLHVDDIKVKSDIRYEIDKLFREHQIRIPFPQHDVHLIKNND